MKNIKKYSISMSILLAFTGFMIISAPAFAEENECKGCHASLANREGLHQAIAMGCTSCHTGIDAARVPHKITNRNSRGLSAKQQELCYGCHDRSKFEKKTVHGAIVLGCTSCHNPHASRDPKLLVSRLPELCFGCHEPSSMSVKSPAHSQISGVACTTCHDPHSTDEALLLFTDVPKAFVQKK